MQKLEGETLKDHLFDYFKLDFNMQEDDAEQVADDLINIIKEHLEEIKTW